MCDTDHVAYQNRFGWECTCGRRSLHLTTKATATHAAEQHERYCFDGGETQLTESLV